jgi:hypothetical protein
MSPELRKTPAPWLQWVLLVLAVTVAFGAAARDYYMAADDLFATGMMDEVDRGGRAGFLEKLDSVVFRAAGGGHFRPAQDVLYVVLYEVFGVERWIRAAMLVYVLCQLASARLVFAIMTALGCSSRLAFSAALAFVLHPTFDENLASVQFANNVPGLTAALGACLLWLPAEGASRRRHIARLVGAAALVCVAIGFGINLMVSVPVLLGAMAVAIAVRMRSPRELVERGIAVAAALGVSLLHRFLAYGDVSTRHGSYPDVKPSHDLPTFLREVFDAVVLLKVSPR